MAKQQNNTPNNNSSNEQQPASRIAERYRRRDEVEKEAPVAAANDFKAPAPAQELLFSSKNFLFFGIGIAVVVVGFLLMSGGQMPNPDTFDESVIYSPLRITVAPFMVLLGLGVIVYGIFKNDDSKPSEPIL